MKLFMFLLLFSGHVFSETKISCGVYKFQGLVRNQDHDVVLLIHEKSLSEIKLSLSAKEQAKAAPYVNLQAKGTLRIVSVSSPLAGSAQFNEIDYGNSDPLNLDKHSFLHLVKGEKCQ